MYFKLSYCFKFLEIRISLLCISNSIGLSATVDYMSLDSILNGTFYSTNNPGWFLKYVFPYQPTFCFFPPSFHVSHYDFLNTFT